MRIDISQKRLHELVEYDPETGLFTATVSRGHVKAGTVLGGDNGDGYIKFSLDGNDYFAHRLAFLYVHGYLPDVVDHANGIRSDNRIANIRVADNSLNARNSSKKRYSLSRFKGASFDKRRKKWVAHIRAGGNLIYLGRHNTDVEAAFAYDVASLEMHGEYGKRNFLPLVA
jgi:hypothetical protein